MTVHTTHHRQPGAPALSPGGDRFADWTRSPLGLLVPPRQRRHYELPVAVEFFAGAGGFGCGLHQAGFHVAAAVELDFDAATTYMVNLAVPGVQMHFDNPERAQAFERHLAKAMKLKLDRGGNLVVPDGYVHRGPLAGSGWISGYGRPHDPASHPNEFLAEINKPPAHPFGCEQFFVADVRHLTGAQILDTLGLDVGDVALVTGGPPCQGFSMAGRRQVMDPRNSLVFEFARLICEIRPRAFVMENVVGLTSMVTPEGIPVVDAFTKALDDGGYGEYEALRRSLGISPGARGAVRGAKRVRHTRPDGAEETEPADGGPEEEQLDLFGPDVALR